MWVELQLFPVLFVWVPGYCQKRTTTTAGPVNLCYSSSRTYPFFLLSVPSRSASRLSPSSPFPALVSINSTKISPAPTRCSQASRGFVSKWAEKLLKTSKKWFTSPDQPSSSPAVPAAAAATAAPPPLPPDGAGSGLIDASAASRAAAMGQTQSKVGRSGESGDGGGRGGGGGGGNGGVVAVDPADRAHSYDAGSVLALSELFGVLLRRWGTGANASNQVMQVKG